MESTTKRKFSAETMANLALFALVIVLAGALFFQCIRLFIDFYKVIPIRQEYIREQEYDTLTFHHC